MSGGPPPKQRQVTDEELLRAVEHVCNTQRPPVAKSSEVADVEFIDVKQQTVKRRLDKLDKVDRVGGMKVGVGKVWWPIDQGDEEPRESSGEIYWGGIEPEQIPDDMIKEHPEFPTRTLARKVFDAGRTILFSACVVTVIGLAIVLPDSYNLDYIPIPPELDPIGAIAFLGGVMFLITGFLLLVAGNLLWKTEWEQTSLSEWR